MSGVAFGGHIHGLSFSKMLLMQGPTQPHGLTAAPANVILSPALQNVHSCSVIFTASERREMAIFKSLVTHTDLSKFHRETSNSQDCI